MLESINISKTVWIVDDDPVSRLLIKKTLERTDLFSSYREFIDGSDFISELSNLGNLGFIEPDLILLDINMPGKDGWEVLDFIQDNNISFDKSHVVLLSSSINPKDKTKGLSYDSINGYLQKPLAKDHLESLNL